MQINSNAPVQFRGETVIPAPIEQVWAVLTDIPNWPDWNPDVQSAELHGELTPGTAFTWKTGSGTIRSTLQVVNAPHEIGWTGRLMGIHAVHVWQLKENGGETKVTTDESWEGWIVRLLKPWMQRMLDEAIQKGLLSLSARFENSPGASTSADHSAQILPD